MADLLLVENDPRILELMTFFLERAGHIVRAAPTFEAAAMAIRERPPDLMLSDLELGKESGREELPNLAARGLLPPTLVVSGRVDRETAEGLAGLPGILGTLAKPFDMKQLAQRVAECLARTSGTGISGAGP
jgi:DNA-binding response OmpR family regulator